MAYKQRSPNKFIGKALRKARKSVMGASTRLFGAGQGDDTSNTGAIAPGMGMLQGVSGMGPMNKKTGYTPYKTISPMKTDALLVRGAYDAASGKGTRKYGQIAKSRAFADMVDSVERTTNRSSKVQLSKARRRSKRTVRSNDKFENFRERYERRRQRKERFRDRFRGKKRKAIDYSGYQDQYAQQPTGQRYDAGGLTY
tara:strand:+ start:1078 stop:1671 length:594 start_codon:yes stop_codon:yes gene_type:complete